MPVLIAWAFKLYTYGYMAVVSLQKHRQSDEVHAFIIFCGLVSNLKQKIMDLDKILKAKKWYRLSRAVGNCLFYYSFFILEMDGTTYILNTRTHNITSIEGINHHIIPALLNIPSSTFYGKWRTVKVAYQEYICIDNMLLSADFKQTFIKTKYESNPRVLDTLGYYVAVVDFQGIHILKMNWKYGHELILNEIPYHFKYIENGTSYRLYIDNVLDIKFFNPIEEEFKVDVKTIQKLHKDSLERKKQEYIPDNYNLYDALDGDTEAYWNIY